MSTSNGTTTQRKTLSSQIDRLDNILDGLSDGLQEAVADAVQQAVGEAVRISVRETIQGVIQELVSNPEFLDTIRTVVVPPQSNVPTSPHAPQAEPSETNNEVSQHWVSWLWSWIAPILMVKWSMVQVVGQRLWTGCQVVWAHRWSLASLTGVGLGVGVTSFCLGPVCSAIVAGLGGISLTVLVMAAVAFRRVFGMSETIGIS